MCDLAKGFRCHAMVGHGADSSPHSGVPAGAAAQIAGCISSALGTAAEWQRPLCVVLRDVQSAFDRMSPALAAEALREQGTHPAHPAALLATTVGVHCRPRLGRIEGEPVLMDTLGVEPLFGAGGHEAAPEMVGC